MIHASWDAIIYTVSHHKAETDTTDIYSFSGLEVAKKEFETLANDISEEINACSSTLGDYFPEKWMAEALSNKDLSSWEKAGCPEGVAWKYILRSNEVECRYYRFGKDSAEQMKMTDSLALHACVLDGVTDSFFFYDYAENDFSPFSKDTWLWSDDKSIRDYSDCYNSEKTSVELKEKNKEIWKVCVRTSLPNVCHSGDKLKESVTSFNSFEEARDVFRKTVYGYAFNTNSMFNGAGEIKNFKKYIQSQLSEKDGVFDSLYKEVSLQFEQALKQAFSGETVDTSSLPENASDSMIHISMKDNTLRLKTGNDGYMNGYIPRIETNIFDMSEPKHYFLYVDDLFDVPSSSELYIDLLKG